VMSAFEASAEWAPIRLGDRSGSKLQQGTTGGKLQIVVEVVSDPN